MVKNTKRNERRQCHSSLKLDAGVRLTCTSRCLLLRVLSKLCPYKGDSSGSLNDTMAMVTTARTATAMPMTNGYNVTTCLSLLQR